MAKLKGAAKQAFLARMAKGRKKTRRSSAGSAMVPFKAMPLGNFVGQSSPAKRSNVRGKLTAVLEMAAKKQSLITSVGAGGLLGYLDHKGYLQQLPEIDSVNGLDNKFTLAAGLYLLADTDVLASMPKLRLFAMDVANVSAGIGSYNATRVYLAKSEAPAAPTPVAGLERLQDRHREEF